MSRSIPDPVDEPFLTTARVAAIMVISERGVLYAVERGEIHAVRVGRAVRIPTAQFLAQYGLTPDTNGAGSATDPATANASTRDAITDDNRSDRTAA